MMISKRMTIVAMVLVAIMLVATGAGIQAGLDRPVPPDIQTYGLPVVGGGYPVECEGIANCGTMCFYVNELNGQYELSCVPWKFTP